MSFEQRTPNDICLPSTPSADAIRTRLQRLKVQTTVLGGETREALSKLALQLVASHEKGATYEALSGALGECGICVGPGALETYLRDFEYDDGSYWAAQDSLPEQVKANAIEIGLREALETGDGLFLLYQPQVDMYSGEVIGAEALVRWRNGSVIVSPIEFIPVAERCGLIGDIGAWVMREACSEAVRWHGMGLGQGRGIKVSVNLSVKQFSEKLVAQISQVLQEAGLRTELFSVEITESFLAGDKSQAILDSLTDMGVQIAIDDFGTGYSCLSRVSRLPLDTIKIDREFVTPLGSSGAADAVVETIINLAEKLGMTTIAEGVETPLQVRSLMSLGCKVAQGFLYARPLSSDDFIDFVKSKENMLHIT
ncbi:bifunctional diguanylate cyclase/phosphodiesterase [Comamonas testosteroni]|jgi:EAL domain-containing protein (putative c-di-GMP-specific phosphodiesterase class I)|uniref:putative bifunctional diguanylate cyclase/phosphodiesterase n=1 Tax=Comamonas testosteroni TaxID=285 RepID=UPI0026EFC058|nr:EAL domain-containing protein [Comamonas testosteroni]